MLTSGVAVTFSVVVPLTPLEVAVIVAVPAAAAVATLPDIVATVVFDDVQVAVADTSCVVPSLSFAVAVNAWVCPTAIHGLAGVTVMLVMNGGTTLTLAVPDTPFFDAVIVAVPSATALSTPLVPTVATAVLLLVHVT